MNKKILKRMGACFIVVLCVLNLGIAKGGHIAQAEIKFLVEDYTMLVIDPMNWPESYTIVGGVVTLEHEAEVWSFNSPSDGGSDTIAPPTAAFAELDILTTGPGVEAYGYTPGFWGEGALADYSQIAFAKVTPPGPAPYDAQVEAKSTLRFNVQSTAIPTVTPITILLSIPFEWSLKALVDDHATQTAEAGYEIQISYRSELPGGIVMITDFTEGPDVPLSFSQTANYDNSGSDVFTSMFSLPEMTADQVANGFHTIDITAVAYAEIEAIVPEPATLMLLGFGGLVLRKRHRR